MTRLLLIALALTATALAAEGELQAPEVTRTRGLLAISVRGTLRGASGPLEARLRRDERTALAVPVAADAAGAFAVDLLTPRLLPADRYVLEVGPPGGAALLARPFAVGSDAEVAAARARVEAWYRAAYGTLRDLAAGLDRRGAYHAALARQDRELHAARLDAALETWWGGLRAARMDLATWERRLVLPWRPEVGERLLEVLDGLAARAEAWRAAVAGRGEPPQGLGRGVEPLLVALDAGEGARAAWEAGPLAVPPPGAPAGSAALDGVAWEGGFGRVRDPLFTLEVPEGATALPADQRPGDRLLLELPGGAVRIMVQAQELPDAAGGDAMAAAIETGAWEQHLSYKRLATTRLGDDGLRLEFTAQVEQTGKVVHVVQVSRWRGARALHLLVVRPTGAPAPGWLERVLASFGVQ